MHRVFCLALSPDEDKRYAWPSYVVGLRARHRCPVWLLAVCRDESVARWAAKPVDLGVGSVFQALVLGPSGIPIVKSRTRAREDPELAVLSAMAHGRALETMGPAKYKETPLRRLS